MMKHETHTKPMPISSHHNNNNNNNMIVSTAIANSPSSGKRSLWRTRSSSEAPTGPRSPITKAFDFLPWSRSKKNASGGGEKGGGGGGGEKGTQVPTTTTTTVGSGQSPSVDEDNNNKKDCIHYHRNIFRNGGGIIRDILGDKLNKDKQQPVAVGQPKKGSGTTSPRKPKQVVARNKSLDINELINCVENELAAEGKRAGGRNRFLDDTFIENILRSKGGSNSNNDHRLSQHQQDFDQNAFYGEPGADDHGEIYANEAMRTRTNSNNMNNNNNNNNNSSNINNNSNTNNNSNNNHPSPKHILFNDENVVYLIKKELPVKREASRTKAAAMLEHGGGSKTLPRSSKSSTSASAMSSSASEKVLKARLKLKKLTPEATPLPEPKSPQHHQQQQHQQRSYLQSKSVIDNCAVIGLGGIGLSLNGGAGGSGKRSILQRQNTMPVGSSHHDRYDYDYDLQHHQPHHGHAHHNQPNAHHRRLDSPDPGRRDHSEGRRHHQLFQRAEQRAQMVRRRSLTDTSFENSSLFDNSSSSSMGSGGGTAGGGGGIIVERPKTDKPRKKLSFREPVVSEKTRSRRRSSPLQRSLGSPVGGGSAASIAGGAGMNNSNSNNNSNHNSSNNINNNSNNINNTNSSNKSNSIVNGNCDNLSKLLDSRYAARGVIHVSVDQSFGAAPANDCQDNQDPESQAMRIVRTVGQAFEVCHKFNLHKNSLDNNDERSDVSSDLLDVEHISEHQLSDDEVGKKDQIAVTPDLNPPQRPNHLELVPQSNMNIRNKSPSLLTDEDKSPTTPSSPSREIHKLKDQLEQQALQTRQALAQLMLVREQLISETNARIEAQARTQQLLQQNRELLEHLASLGAYTEQQTPGLTSANIAMAPQSQLQMLLQATSNNNNLATINQQINNLGSINQQLTSLSHQLSGLNQQSQNLQNLKNMNVNVNLQQQQQQQQQHHHQQQQQQQQQHQQSLTPPTPSTSLHHSQLHLNVSAANTSSSSPAPLSSSPFPSMNQLQNISTQLQNMSLQSSQQQQHQQQQDALSKDLFQVNQELLNRLQALNLGAGNAAGAALTLNGSPLPQTTQQQQQQQTPSPHSSFFFVNPMSCSPSTTATNNNNNSPSNFNFLASPGSLGPASGTLTPSPMGTLSRNSFSNSTTIHDELGLSIDQNLNALDEHLIKPLGQLCSATSNGNIAAGGGGSAGNSRSSSTLDSPSSPNTRNNNNNNNMGNEPRFNTVMLKVTDEAGNVTNQRKLSATPSFITRSTSEKVPNRSQMMSQVQRTAWARHTTK